MEMRFVLVMHGIDKLIRKSVVDTVDRSSAWFID